MESGEGGEVLLRGRFCGCGWFEGLWFWVVVVMSAKGGMEGKVVELGEGKWREGEGSGAW